MYLSYMSHILELINRHINKYTDTSRCIYLLHIIYLLHVSIYICIHILFILFRAFKGRIFTSSINAIIMRLVGQASPAAAAAATATAAAAT